MTEKKKVEIAVSILGLGLTTLGILIPGCFALTFLGVLLTTLGLGMLIGGADERW